MNASDLINAIAKVENQEKEIDRCREELNKAEENFSDALHELRSLVRIDPEREVALAGRYVIGYLPDKDDFELQCVDYVEANDPEGRIESIVEKFHEDFEKVAMGANCREEIPKLLRGVVESIRGIAPDYDGKKPIIIDRNTCYNFDNEMRFRSVIIAE